jgi:hypothetical protein
MAIIDLASLKTAINVWADLGNTLDDQLADVVQMTTHMLNYGSEEMSPLRVREMETVATLTPTNGICTLPTDYLQYRRVTVPSSLRRELSYITPSISDDLYPDRGSGSSCNFTIIGSSLYTFPLTSSDVELTYYQAIPDIVNDTDTNWLLTAHPLIYLHGSLFNVAMIQQWDGMQSRSAAMLRTLVSGLMTTNELGNYAYAPSRVRGITVA